MRLEPVIWDSPASAAPVDQCVKMHVMPPVRMFKVALKGCFEIEPGPNRYSA